MANIVKETNSDAVGNYQGNIVPAEKQNNKNIYLGDKKGSPRVLFVGNSITKHSIKPDIGWMRDCGMAASCAECDYVHIVSRALKEKYPQASFGILQVATFERNFDKGFNLAEEYREAIEWQPDIAIFFFGANVPASYDSLETPEISFGTKYEELRNLLNSGSARFYHVEGFYLRPVLTRERNDVCQKYHDTWVPLTDINTRPETHGLFNHPNDEGMRLIAQRILSHMK